MLDNVEQSVLNGDLPNFTTASNLSLAEMERFIDILVSATVSPFHQVYPGRIAIVRLLCEWIEDEMEMSFVYGKNFFLFDRFQTVCSMFQSFSGEQNAEFY